MSNPLAARPRAPQYLLLLVIVPGLVWIVLDRAMWSSDEALFGLSSLKLHYALSHEPARWWSEMVNVPLKPPMLPWLGQFTVPAGRALGHLNSGLLLVPLAAYFGTLALQYGAARLWLGDRRDAMLAVVTLASTPLAIELSTQFYVQSLQALSVAWFVYVMFAARRWDAPLIVMHLAAASAFAMLVTTSSLVVAIIPAAIAAAAIRDKPAGASRWTAGHSVALLLSAPLVLAAASWYLVNGAAAFGYADWSFRYASGGVSGGFVTRLLVWVALLARGMLLAALAVIAAIALLAVRRGSDRTTGAFIVTQIVVVLLVFALSTQHNYRYLLPLAVYAGLLMAWVMSRRPNLRNAAIVVLLLQFAAVHVARFTGLDEGVGLQTRAPDAQQVVRAVVDKSAELRCTSLTVAAGALGFYHPHVDYQAAQDSQQYLRRYFRGSTPAGETVEFMFTGSPLEGTSGGEVAAVWQRIMATAGCVVAVSDPARHRHREEVRRAMLGFDHGWFNVLDGTDEISRRLASSGRFQAFTLLEFPDVTIFRAVSAKVERQPSIDRATRR